MDLIWVRKQPSRRLAVAASLVLLLLVLCSAPAAAQKHKVLLQEDVLDVSSRKSAELKTRIVVEFVERPSVDEATFVFTGSYYNRLKDLKAILRKQDGSSNKYGTDDFVETSGPLGDISAYDPGMFTDVKTYIRYFDDAEAGDILDIEKKTKVTNLVMCPVFLFQGADRIEERRLLVNCPTDVAFSHHSLDFEDPPAPQVKEDGEKRVYEWIQRDIAPLDYEERAADVHPPAVYLRFPGPNKLGVDFTMDSWDAIAEWYSTLTRGRTEPNNDVLKLIDTHGIGADNEEKTVRSAYDYVRKNIRYVGLELGIGRFEPRSAKEVAFSLYGDCKDKSTLLISLLQSQGIDAKYVLVRTHGARPLPENLPSRRFNHVITAVELGGERVFLDPTCDDCPYRYLPPPDQGAFALVIDGERGTPLHLPGSTVHDNFLIDEITLEVGKTGDTSFRHKRSAGGAYGISLRASMEKGSDEKLRKSVKRIYRPVPALEVTDVEYVEGAESDTVSFVSKGTISNYTDMAGGYLIIDPNIIQIRAAVPSEDTDRKTKFDLGLPRKHVKVVTVNAPDGWTPLLDDETSTDLKTDYLTYEHTRELIGSAIRISSQFTCLQKAVAPDRFVELRELLRKVVDNDKKELVYSKK